MANQWYVIEDEIIDLLTSDSFDVGGKWNKYLLKWGNRLINQIAQEMDIRDHFQTCTRVFTTADTSAILPDIFFKVSERFTRVRISGTDDDSYISIVGLDTLLEYDPDRDETTTGIPDAVSIESKRIYPYPLFAGTLILENYLREPTQMTDRYGYPDLPYDVILDDLLINGICKKAFIWLQDYDIAKVCSGEYERLLGLYRMHIDKSNSREVNETKDY